MLYWYQIDATPQLRVTTGGTADMPEMWCDGLVWQCGYIYVGY